MEAIEGAASAVGSGRHVHRKCGLCGYDDGGGEAIWLLALGKP